MLLVPDSKNFASLYCLDLSVAAARDILLGDGIRDNIEKETKSSNMFALISTIERLAQSTWCISGIHKFILFPLTECFGNSFILFALTECFGNFNFSRNHNASRTPGK